MTRQPARRYFPCSEREIRLILRQLERFLDRTYDSQTGAWDKDWDPYGYARIDNALIVLSTVDLATVQDPKCRELLIESVHRLLDEHTVEAGEPGVQALPFEPVDSVGTAESRGEHPRGKPDLGTTLQFLWVVRKFNQGLAQGEGSPRSWLDEAKLRPLYRFLNRGMDLNYRLLKRSYSWHLASALRLAASEQQ